MKSINNSSYIFGASLIALGIVFGAFGAHALKDMLTFEQLQSFETGVRYQIYHGIALLLIPLISFQTTLDFNRSLRLIKLGVLLFSGSIYLLILLSKLSFPLFYWVWMTPLGGLLLISAWIMIISKLFRKESFNA